MGLSDAEAKPLLVATIRQLPERIRLALELALNYPTLTGADRGLLLRCSEDEADMLVAQGVRVVRPILARLNCVTGDR